MDPRNRQRLTLILSLGLLVQGSLIYRAHHPAERGLVGDEVHYHSEALRLLAGGPGIPSFVFPPLYSWALAGVYGIFGPHRIAAELIQSVLFLCCGLALRSLLLRAGCAAIAADIALGLFLTDLGTASFALYLWPEVVHLLLVLLAVSILVRGADASAGRALAAGALCGLAVLAKLLLGPFLPILAGVAALRGSPPSAHSRALRAVLFCVGVLAVVAPVAIANGLRHGYWGIANSGPFNVWVGLNDPASRSDYDSVVVPEGAAYLASSPDPAERNRIVWGRVFDKIRNEGVFSIVIGQIGKQYGRLFDRESFFTDQLPGGRWRQGEPRLAGDTPWRAWAYATYAAVLILAGLGLVLADWRGRFRTLALPALFLAYNLGLFLLLHVKTRYRFAFTPPLLFFAALAVGRLQEVWRRPGEASGSRGRWVAALALAALWVALAFGSACPRR